ncbi:hypothetical protein C1646_755129 [Rhizophagus diaphanus]|nr:hypothetical protein C1646_755129 [Rhizophagus diaphanus] [Rhizophagus sp. MUCL 43196]
MIFEDSNLEKRTIQTGAPFNLDRIDQKTFPLDGKYNYSTNAGSGGKESILKMLNSKEEQALEKFNFIVYHLEEHFLKQLTNATEKSTDDIPSFTNTESCVQIFAPGRDIIAAGAHLSNSLSMASGTSQACPHVAGTIINNKGNMSPSSMINELITLSPKNILKDTKKAKPNRFLRIPSS